MKRSVCITLLCFLYSSTALAQNEVIRFDFSNATAAANNITLQGAGFGLYPQAEVTFGAIPTDNAFENATDGKGIVIHAAPGEGIMLLTPTIETDRCALIRCSVRVNAPHASLNLASINSGDKTYISTTTSSNPSFYVGRYDRIAIFPPPPTNGFQAVIQITNTSQTETLTAYLDNLEIVILGKDRIEIPVTDIIGQDSSIPITPSPTPHIDTFTVPLTLPAEAKELIVVKIPAGTFTMGSPTTERYRDSDEGPQHTVALTEDFYMGMYEITQAQWQAVMGNNPSFNQGNDRPVERVSWYDCQSFIQKLNQMGYGTFRLPTEAEWEYACRAGTTTRFYWGEDLDYRQINDRAWYNQNSDDRTNDVGVKLPNAFGLFDMSGNVWEWCQDWYGSYTSENQTNPGGAVYGSYKVYRSGSWNNLTTDCRSANRYRSEPNRKSGIRGFRLCRNP